jgi:hypothetical protein
MRVLSLGCGLFRASFTLAAINDWVMDINPEKTFFICAALEDTA